MDKETFPSLKIHGCTLFRGPRCSEWIPYGYCHYNRKLIFDLAERGSYKKKKNTRQVIDKESKDENKILKNG